MDQLGRRTMLLQLGCVLMVAAAGLRAFVAVVFEHADFTRAPGWTLGFLAGFVVFAGACALVSGVRPGLSRTRAALLAAESISALYLVWLYPNFIVTGLLVVVAWQFAWTVSLRAALGVAVFHAVVLAAMKCVNQSEGMSLLILVSSAGFQMFAVSAAHLARSEAEARDGLARANAELTATHALLTETARMSERLQISRDLHDVLGHSLTTLTIHLDVATRLARGKSAEHLQCARDVAGTLLDDVRDVVRRARVQPVDLRETLRRLTEGLTGLNVRLVLPDDLAALDPPRADAFLRCVQEVITNTLRHAKADELVVELRQAPDGSITLTAVDNGRGGPFREGHGLAGMRERFEALGGSLSVSGVDGAGFRVSGAIPAFAVLP